MRWRHDETVVDEGESKEGFGTGGEGNGGGDELNKIMESWITRMGVATQWGWSASGKQAWGREAEHEVGGGSLSMSLRQGGSDGGWPWVMERDGWERRRS